MAMTKAEKEKMLHLETQLELERSLRWPVYSKPAHITDFAKEWERPGVKIAENNSFDNKLVKGFFYNEHSRTVTEGCCDGTRFKSDLKQTHFSQYRGEKMFINELDALYALRCELSLEYALNLRSIDRKIVEAGDFIGPVGKEVW